MTFRLSQVVFPAFLTLLSADEERARRADLEKKRDGNRKDRA